MNRADTLYKTLSGKETFFLISGPCVIEGESLMMKTAEYLKKITTDRGIPFIFKSSFTKANRTSASSYNGPGLDSGLKLLQKIKVEFDVPILTDVHETHEVSAIAEVSDVIQIPAFLCRQTALIIAASQSNLIVNIKKGQFLAPEDMANPLEKALSTGNQKVMLTERGTTFGYHNLVVDMRSFAIMKTGNHPIIYDVTHSMQRPSIGSVSGGTPEFAPMMARAAIATGYVNGLFIESHPEPAKALCDANTVMALDALPKVLDECKSIYVLL
jgi:2-dehydro-3-deoxyphosphooctonate aldolase (KDO 8-P synthase)